MYPSRHRARPCPGPVQRASHQVETFRVACSQGEWPRALVARRWKAFNDSIALIPDMKAGGGLHGVPLVRRSWSEYGVSVRNWAFPGTYMGRRFLLDGLRARGRAGEAVARRPCVGGKGGRSPPWSTGTTVRPTRPSRPGEAGSLLNVDVVYAFVTSRADGTTTPEGSVYSNERRRPPY
jgi:hypothetical protein